MHISSTLRAAYNTIRGVLIAAPWLAHLLLADILLSALLPVSVLAPSFSYNLSSRAAESVWRAIQFIFTGINGAQITVSGTELPPGESAIIVANHVAWTDFYMIQALAVRAGMLGRCRWFAKKQLKWVPFLGWGLWALGAPMVSRNWTKDKHQLENAFGQIVRQKRPIWLISYSEGTRFTSQKHASTVRWCEEHDKPIPRNTLHPRPRGFVATVSELRRAPHIRAVYDITIAYAKENKFMRAPGFWESVCTPRLGEQYKFHVNVERHLLDELPHGEAELTSWLEGRWVEKDARLEALRKSLGKGEGWE